MAKKTDAQGTTEQAPVASTEAEVKMAATGAAAEVAADEKKVVADTESIAKDAEAKVGAAESAVAADAAALAHPAHSILDELEALVNKAHHFEAAGLILKLRADAKALIERVRAAL